MEKKNRIKRTKTEERIIAREDKTKKYFLALNISIK
jgi:hypothetical protein